MPYFEPDNPKLVHTRAVQSDALVGEWMIFDEYPSDLSPDVHTLSEWLFANHFTGKLEREGFDEHLWGYKFVGMGWNSTIQFWVPLPTAVGGLVICNYAEGIEGLVEGTQYLIHDIVGNIYVVADDKGNVSEALKDRFSIPQTLERQHETV